jgi:hypothetical protein
MPFRLFGLALVSLFLSCSPPAGAPAPDLSVAPSSDPIPHTRDADDVGRFLAGLPARTGSPFAALDEQPAWLLHRRELDLAWNRIESETIAGMHEFQKRELSQARIADSLVFYPFSGPDALILTVLFPESSTYVMVGLEPAGTLPSLKQFERQDLAVSLARVRDTVYSELHRSFFITREMDRQFRGQVTDGLFAPILQLLVRTNHTLLGFRYVRLDEQGRVIERSPNYHAPGKIGNKGVEIDFRTDSDQSFHKLFYFSVNLSDERLSQDQPFLTFLAGLKGMTTFFKATSYMMHKPEFSIIRERVLAGSAAILQDDSGIPYRFLSTATWKVQLYGDYDRPYGSFRWLEQPDLRKAYTGTGPKPLGFRIGYGFSRAPSNLLLARRIVSN